MLEKIARIGWLFELYGGMLTDRQKQLVQMYYFDDLSLAEIAGELEVSRQAVYFGIKRAEEALERYERELSVYARQTELKKKAEKALGLIEAYLASGGEEKLLTAGGVLRDMIDVSMP